MYKDAILKNYDYSFFDEKTKKDTKINVFIDKLLENLLIYPKVYVLFDIEELKIINYFQIEELKNDFDKRIYITELKYYDLKFEDNKYTLNYFDKEKDKNNQIYSVSDSENIFLFKFETNLSIIEKILNHLKRIDSYNFFLEKEIATKQPLRVIHDSNLITNVSVSGKNLKEKNSSVIFDTANQYNNTQNSPVSYYETTMNLEKFRDQINYVKNDIDKILKVYVSKDNGTNNRTATEINKLERSFISVINNFEEQIENDIKKLITNYYALYLNVSVNQDSFNFKPFNIDNSLEIEERADSNFKDNLISAEKYVFIKHFRDRDLKIENVENAEEFLKEVVSLKIIKGIELNLKQQEFYNKYYGIQQVE